MKTMRTCLFVLFLAGLAPAQTNLIQNPGFESGTKPWAFQVNAPATKADGQFQVLPEAAHSGTQGAQVTINTAYDATNNWYLQLQVPSWEVKPHSRYRVSFWAKGTIASLTMGFLDVPNNYAWLGGVTSTFSSSWKKYTSEFATDAQSGSDVAIGIYLAGATGTFLFDDFEAVELVPLDSSWFPAHLQRVDSLRKKSLKVTVNDSSGKTVVGAQIHLRLQRHAWPFGTALSFTNTDAPNATEQWYRSTAASSFNQGVFENDFKWPSYEPTPGAPDTARIDRYLKWADSVGMHLRGHALVWAIQQYGYDKFWATDTSINSCTQIADNIKARIFRDLARYKGRLHEYDVWNEALHEQAFFVKCGTDARFAPDGWGLQDSAFVWARRADPTAKLYINDYNNVDGGDNEAYYAEIRGMLDRGIPVDGIGIQCHLGGQDVNPALLNDRLNRLASLGLPIKVTEFDNERFSGTRAFTPAKQATQFNRFVRTMFSHPAVEGMLLWGFWDSRHWDGAMGAGIYDATRKPKPAVDSLHYLWDTLWTTDTTINLDPSGSASWRGFPGRYLASVSVDGRIWELPVDLGDSTSKSLTIHGPGSTGIRRTFPKPPSLLMKIRNGSLSLQQQKTDASDWTIRIVGMDGRIRAVSRLGSSAEETSISLLPGVYFVEAVSGARVVRERIASIR